MCRCSLHLFYSAVLFTIFCSIIKVFITLSGVTAYGSQPFCMLCICFLYVFYMLSVSFVYPFNVVEI